nr:zinc finger BED domain-containing protein RICESLEEPER 2-like [Tanacetum cinerariifolium]
MPVRGDMETQGETSNANTHDESNEVPPPLMTAQIEANDASNEVQQVGRKRKLTSPCWNHFKKIQVNGERKADYNYCYKKLSRSSRSVNNCTTNDVIINNLVDKLPLSSLMMNANVFFTSVCEIGYFLREWSRSSVEVIHKMASKMLEKCNKYCSVISGIMGMTVILDPRYELKFLELLLPKIYGQEKASIEIKTLEEFVKSLFKEYESTPLYIATIASQHDDSSGTTELDNYYNEKPLPKDMKLDILMR